MSGYSLKNYFPYRLANIDNNINNNTVKTEYSHSTNRRLPLHIRIFLLIIVLFGFQKFFIITIIQEKISTVFFFSFLIDSSTNGWELNRIGGYNSA